MSPSAPYAPARHAVYGLIAMAVLTLMDAVIKAVSGPFSAVQILWLRFALTALMAAALLVAWRTPWPSRAAFPGHLLRAISMVISNGTFIYALGALPLAEVFAYALTAPLFLAAFGAVVLKEPLTTLTVTGLFFGLIGTVTIVFGDTLFAIGDRGVGPEIARSPTAVLAALTAPVTYAIGIILLRRQAADEAPVQVVFIQALLVTALVAPALPFMTWSTQQFEHWQALLTIGASSTFGYLVLVKALSGLTAVRYSVIEYTGLVWAGALGWLWFAERPTITLIAGATCVISGATIAVIQREQTKSL